MSTGTAIDLPELEFEWPIEVDGLIARAAANAPASMRDKESRPVRGWGAEIPSETLPVGNDAYTVTTTRHPEHGLGVIVTKIYNRFGKNQRRESHWMPFDQFDSLKRKYKAVRL